MQTLYIHVGTGKTGTTTLQHFLHLNEELLNRHGIYLPEAGRQPVVEGCAYHRIASSLKEKYPAHTKPKMPIHQYMDAIREEHHGGRDILISSEFFSPLKEDALVVLKQATSIFPSVKIIIYLRRQDEHALSFYAQKIKGGDIYTVTESMRMKRDWYALCEKWANIFGKENIIVRIFDRERFTGGGLECDFLSIFGLDRIDGFKTLPAESNDRFSHDAIEFKRLVNIVFGGLRERPENSKILSVIKQYDQEQVSISKGASATDMISIRERKDLLAQNAESNIKLASIYLNDGEKSPFSDLETKVGARIYDTVPTEYATALLDSFVARDFHLGAIIVAKVAEAVASDDREKVNAGNKLLAGICHSLYNPFFIICFHRVFAGRPLS